MDNPAASIAPSGEIERLVEIMAALRAPVTGCPWDLEQTFQSIAPYTIEEAYEVADAIERSDMVDLQEELGDLLLQVVYHARLAEEARAFAFSDVVLGITTKMIRRHPHVFGDETARSAGMAKGAWERIKAVEKAERAAARGAAGTAARPPSLLDDIPRGHAALKRAVKLQEKAARVGFDWPSLAPVFEKMREEMAELEAVARPADPRGPQGAAAAGDAVQHDQVVEEFGDLLFVMANVARHLMVDPETALRAANAKFQRRFTHIETRLAASGRTPEQSDLAEMDALWNEAKAEERR